MRRFPEKFSHDFEENKRVVGMLLQGTTTKVRNQIAGYITHAYAPVQTASTSSPEENVEEK